MRISAISSCFRKGFNSLRTDKKDIEELKTGEKSLIENKKANILAALNNISARPDREGVEFLLDIAGNLKYGEDGDSEFKDIIDSTTAAGEDRENTDWSKQLSVTIRAALDKLDGDVSDLEEQYTSEFKVKKPLTQEQRDVLDLRKKFQIKIVDDETFKDAQSLSLRSSIIKNIDYFISSSEIPIKQKKECLEHFLYFLGDEYKINPQLKDKKLQIVEEMLDDMVIKTPDSDVLTNKGVDQKYSGICAAISICRKAVAYEDKVRYMEIVMDELKDSPYMTVFDITSLGTGEKVNIPKINIDYNSAIEQGYRIIDASAHNWMQNAHASGNGTIQTESYVAFDPKTYGIFDDSSWYDGINTDFTGEKTLLQSLIKEKESLDSVLKIRKKIKTANQTVMAEKSNLIEVQSHINGKIFSMLKSFFPSKSDGEITSLQRDLRNFYKGKNGNEINVSEKLSDEVKQKIISDFLKTYSQDGANEDKIDAKAPVILQLLTEEAEQSEKIKKLTSYNTKRGNYQYYRNLYNLAAAHRMAVEADVNLKDGIIRFERISGLPPRNQQVISYLKQLKPMLAKDKVRKEIACADKAKSQRQLEEELSADIVRVAVTIPQETDNIAKSMFGDDIKTLAKRMFQSRIEAVKKLSNDDVADYANFLGVKNDKVKVINFINKRIEKLDNNPSDKDIEESIRYLGFDDRFHMLDVFMSQFIAQLNQGITEEQFDELAKRFGSKDKVGESINSLGEKYNQIKSEYDSITDKWKVPSHRNTIITQLEKQNSIIPENKLRKLQSRFAYIRKMSAENDKIENTKAKEKANSALYEFTNEELDIIKQIEKQIPDMKKYCNIEYQAINSNLFDELERQYSYIGMLNGQFWVREEGSSGLSSNEQVRIIEQMTGKPYHIEEDIEEAAKEIKKGNGSGIISYSVDDESYAFHAQYAPSVTSETFKNPVTGKTDVEDVLWTDNSWGNAEKEYFWNGRNGFNYTDYGRGYGWQDGFILSKDMKIGQKVQTIKSATGVDSKDKEKFSLFLDMVLPGTPAKAYQKLYKMFGYILTINQNAEFMKMLEEKLKSGVKLDIDFLEGIDDYVEKINENLDKKIKTIKSKEDFDKLPEDDFLRFVMEVLSLYLATNNPVISDEMLEIDSMEDLKKAKEDIINDYVDEIGAIFAKSDKCVENIADFCAEEITKVFKDLESKFNLKFTDDEIANIITDLFFDEEAIEQNDGTLQGLRNYLKDRTEKIAVDTFDSEEQSEYFADKVNAIITDYIDKNLVIKDLSSPVLANSPLHETIIDSIDKYLNPSSDKELLDFLIGLQNCDYETADKFFDMLTPEDLGIKFKHPYEYIVKLQLGDSSINKAFSEVVATNIISKEMDYDSKGNKIGEEDDEQEEQEVNTPEMLYRHLYIRLSEMDVQKYIQNFKAEAFQKYKLRQAFPQPVVLPDSAIMETAGKFLEYIDTNVWDIKSQNYIIDILDEYEDIIDYFKKTSFYNSIINGDDFIIDNDKTRQEMNILQNQLRQIAPLIEKDSSLDEIHKAVNELIGLLDAKHNIIEGEKAKKAFDLIDGTLRYSDSQDSLSEKHREEKENRLKELRLCISQFIEANIDPSYRNEASSVVKNIINLTRNEASEESIQKEKEKLVNLTIEKHIIKNPTVLLKEWVKLIEENKTDTLQYQTVSTYLYDALKVAQQTKIQYKLVQNAHEAISSKTKDMLSLFNVILSNGKKESMDSEMGILYLIEQLKNQSDDYETLKLFLSQTGLSKKALTALINNMNIQSTSELADNKYESVKKQIEELNELNKNIGDFFEKSKIPYKSVNDAVKHLSSYVKRHHKFKNSEMLKTYTEYFDSIENSNEVENISKNMIIPVVYSLNQDIITAITAEINAGIDFIADLIELLNENALLLDVIEVPEDSQEFSRRENFFGEIENVQQHIKDKLAQITKFIENAKYVSVQYCQ